MLRAQSCYGYSGQPCARELAMDLPAHSLAPQAREQVSKAASSPPRFPRLWVVLSGAWIAGLLVYENWISRYGFPEYWYGVPFALMGPLAVLVLAARAAPADAAAEGPGVIPADTAATIVISYLILHMFWRQAVFDPYSFVILRAIFLIPVLVYLTLARRLPVRDVIGHFRLPARTHYRVLMMLLAGVILFWMLFWALAQAASQTIVPLALTAKNILDNCAIAPLSEELVFRGLLLSCLMQVFDQRRWPVVLLGAAIFATCHDRPLMFGAMIGGVLYGIAFVRTRSLTACISLHAVWNALTFMTPLGL
jgi:membrane protease YdiL (CAAX protease family)